MRSVTVQHCEYSLIKLQLGNDPDHIPFDWHVLVSLPHRTNGTSHVYVIVEPRVVFVSIIFPFARTPGCPQLTSTAKQKQMTK